MVSNADLEMRWVDAWNDLYEIVGREEMPCLLPDGTEVSVEACKGWLQDSVYEGYLVSVARGWVRGRPAVVVTRWRGDIA
jgi:hypothetical protein